MLRTELVPLQYKVKMVTADDEQTTDIITEGDVEETTRFCRVRWLPAYAQLTWPSLSQMSQSASRARYISGLYFSACQHVPYACLSVVKELELQEKGKEYVKGILER